MNAITTTWNNVKWFGKFLIVLLCGNFIATVWLGIYLLTGGYKKISLPAASEPTQVVQVQMPTDTADEIKALIKSEIAIAVEGAMRVKAGTEASADTIGPKLDTLLGRLPATPPTLEEIITGVCSRPFNGIPWIGPDGKRMSVVTVVDSNTGEVKTIAVSETDSPTEE